MIWSMACMAKLKVMNSQTGCRPASAAPTVRPQKPDSVMGESITRLSPNLSSSPFVTLYLFNHQHVSQCCNSCSSAKHCAGKFLCRSMALVSECAQARTTALTTCVQPDSRRPSTLSAAFSLPYAPSPLTMTSGKDLRAVILCNLLAQHEHLWVRLQFLDQRLVERFSHRHHLLLLPFLSRGKRPRGCDTRSRDCCCSWCRASEDLRRRAEKSCGHHYCSIVCGWQWQARF